jgi:2-keto-4-pentenoate hydratase/2-oxohepta-3-ene-1,7-dioic acid hydratase in catechol pathway
MGFPIVRYGAGEWGVLKSEAVHPLDSQASSLGALLAEDVAALARRALGRAAVAVSEFLSPVTAPCQIVCQGKNYLDHLLETGTRPENKEHNLLFAKADSSLAAPSGLLRRPPGVRLLDYEVELGLVIGRAITAPQAVREDDLGHYIAGLVMANDVSARDVQVPERQWFRGKSFRGFCPVGPVFYFMEKSDWAQFYALELSLSVNGAVRQKSSAAMLMHRPPETLSLISGTFDLRVGDLVLTGTPGGVSMRVPAKSGWEEIADTFLPDKVKFARFVEQQAASGRYLKAGDRVESTIRTVGGGIDLGRQSLLVAD